MQSYILDHLWFTAEQPSIEDHHFTLNFALGFEKMRAALQYTKTFYSLLPFVMHWIFLQKQAALFNQIFT